jgi:hypothetical protein
MTLQRVRNQVIKLTRRERPILVPIFDEEFLVGSMRGP